MPGDIDIRLLRHFVAVAEELHFTRAARRLYLAQQALSRDISRLEAELGVTLFSRTTRKVTLTPEGQRLLPQARDLVARHDRLLQDLHGQPRPLLVDVVGERRTPALLLDAARDRAPDIEFVARFGGGLGVALAPLIAGRLDVAFGRIGGLPQPLPDQLTHQLIRLEPLGLLLADDHPLAMQPTVKLAELRGSRIDASVGNDAAPEWVDAAVQLFAEYGVEPSPAHHHAVGADETARHLRAQGLPILTHLDGPDVPGAIVRPLADPCPLYPWVMIHQRDLRHPGLATLRDAVAYLARTRSWLDRAADAWIPEPERSQLARATG